MDAPVDDPEAVRCRLPVCVCAVSTDVAHRTSEELASKTREAIAARKEAASANLTMDGMVRHLTVKVRPSAKIPTRNSFNTMCNGGTLGAIGAEVSPSTP